MGSVVFNSCFFFFFLSVFIYCLWLATEDLGRWLNLNCRLKILLCKALIEFAFDIQRDWLIVAKLSTPIKLREDMSFVLYKSAFSATGCCLPYVLIPSPFPSWPKIDVVASLGALPLPCCLMFLVSDQAPVVKDKRAWLPLSLASPQQENSEKGNKMCLFCAEKIVLPLYSATKWLLLMKGSGKSSPGPFFSLLQSPAHFRHCINRNFFHIAALSASFLWAVLFVLFFPPAGSSLSGSGCRSSFPGRGHASQRINPLLFPLCQLPAKLQINFNASLNFKAYKKISALPTLVSWDLFRNPEDAGMVVLGVSVSSSCIQTIPGTI